MKLLFNVIIIIMFIIINIKNAIEKKLYYVILCYKLFSNIIYNINLIKNQFLVL